MKKRVTTIVNGAVVHGDKPLDHKGLEAVSALVGAVRKRLQGTQAELPDFTAEQLDYVAKIAERERTYDGSYLITGPRKTP